MKITVEMEDHLSTCVEKAIDMVRDELISYMKENNVKECTIEDANFNGAIHEIIDSCVPIYRKIIKDIWYLHEDDLTNAYLNAGIGENPLENGGAAAIYLYIEEKVYEWYHNWVESDESSIYS